MTRRVETLLSEILGAIELVQRYVQGVSYLDFAVDVEKQDAAMRRLEIIGEAVKGLPEAVKSEHPGVPWRDIAGARDILIHEYFRVDVEMTWQMVRKDLPALATDIRAIAKSLE